MRVMTHLSLLAKNDGAKGRRLAFVSSMQWHVLGAIVAVITDR